MKTITIPTPKDLTAEAASYGIPLVFEWEDQMGKPYWIEDEDRYNFVTVRQYLAYASIFGIYAEISEEPDRIPHTFYVLFAKDASETNGKGYESLDDALQYMKRLIDEQ